MTSQCSSCRKKKPVDCFYKNKHKKTGRDNLCKVCRSAMSRVHHRAKHEKADDFYGPDRRPYDPDLAARLRAHYVSEHTISLFFEV